MVNGGCTELGLLQMLNVIFLYTRFYCLAYLLTNSPKGQRTHSLYHSVTVNL